MMTIVVNALEDGDPLPSARERAKEAKAGDEMHTKSHRRRRSSRRARSHSGDAQGQASETDAAEATVGDAALAESVKLRVEPLDAIAEESESSDAVGDAASRSLIASTPVSWLFGGFVSRSVAQTLAFCCVCSPTICLIATSCCAKSTPASVRMWKA